MEQTHELRIEVLGVDPAAFMLYRGTAPTGVKVSGLSSEAQNGPIRDLALIFIVKIASDATKAGRDAARRFLRTSARPGSNGFSPRSRPSVNG
jgi:hypothetical protein